ncbi:hypothetical protein GCK72_008572 [Caenorhabditis remanei]|uniref:F-box domain-containing protein n=1 Tax=Caenorhabditis remanei TaxID=31234 RepID=A0A6A5H0M6_CAERE|nr:hypothetical protein GCK72_008572 [Caenorhabditis remanei]KAF1760324.1 hypothetical protein GCK72_008572 [Caenorhabditis remanei]
MQPTFPLLRLPENATIKVLRNLSLEQLFFISLVSSKTKRLVTSLGLRADRVDIRIDRLNEVVVHTQAPYLNLTLRPFTLLEFKDWMNHIRTIFCFTSPANVLQRMLFFQNSVRFTVQSLKDAIGNVSDLFLSRQLTDVMSRNVLKHFNTPSTLFLYRNPFEEVSEIQKIFIQNFKTISFHDVYSLDDMLLVNSESVQFTKPISQKRFNRFVKLWICGSNPRLQRMDLSINKTDVASGEVYLEGIRCMEMSQDAKKEIRQKHKFSVNADMIQIRRNDGTPAVIATYDGQRRLHMFLIVLH